MVRHAILVPFFAWGHLRPECGVAITLVRRFPDLVISFLCEIDFTSRALDEMARQCSTPTERAILLPRIRVIPYGSPQPQMTPELIGLIMAMDPRDLHSPPLDSCAEAVDIIGHLMADEPFEDKKGKLWPAVGSVPRCLVADMMMGNVILPAKEKYGLWVLIWWVGNTASFTRMWAPLRHGGRSEGYAEECDAIFADETRRNGRSFGDIAKDLWIRDERFKGDIIRLAGNPPYYQWEDFPQHFWFPTIYYALALGDKVAKAADGFMMTTLEELEGEAHRDMIQWARPRRVLCLGPQLPPAVLKEENGVSAAAELAKGDVNYHAALTSSSTANGSTNGKTDGHANGHTNGHANGLTKAPTPVDPAIAFLDSCLASHGPTSCLYISFGSVFFPSPSHMSILFDTLLNLEKPMPVVFTTSVGSLEEGVRQRLEQSGRGVVVSWAPQQAVLAHPALGWMLTHCGGGGTFESLSSGIPVIAWPFMGDQPQHALWVSQVLDTGFELLQVRTGYPGGASLRGASTDPEEGKTTRVEIPGTEGAVREELEGVLQRAQGEEGERKRGNARRVKEVILRAVREGGSVGRAIGELEYIL